VRSQQLPNVATIAETLKSPPVVTYNGLLAPGRTPDDIVVAIAHALSGPDRRVEFQERLVKVGAEPIVSTPDEFAKIIAADTDLWRDIVRDLNLRPE
jgi:tripartite-type tricarboxylate transporter receptor subunit TctC